MSIRRENNPNIIQRLYDGAPIKVRWGAWVSDTHMLHREHWKFSAEEHLDEEQRLWRIRLAVTSPDDHVVISGSLYIDVHRMIYASGADWVDNSYPMFDRGYIEMQQFTAKEVFRTIEYPELRSWQAPEPIDITQATTIRNLERSYRMKDFKFFQTLDMEPKNEIYIPEKSVDDLFNEILKIQYPQQQEIKKGLIMPGKQPIIQAKIYSLVA